MLASDEAGITPDADWQLAEILIAARREEWNLLAEIISDVAPQSACAIRLIEGGETRQQSVANAARATSSDLLLIHDAARPLLTTNLIQKVVNAALETGAAIAALPASDTVKIAREEYNAQGRALVGSTPDRSVIWLAQTPQVFARELFLQSLQSAERDNFLGTDCASLVERVGAEVALIEGETENFKVTFATDLARASAILKARQNAVN